MSFGNIEAVWIDGGREPQMPPDPAYPDGVDIDLAAGAARSCRTALTYPARRIGFYLVECKTCGFRAGVTTAGRPDDPRSVTLPCGAAPLLPRSAPSS